MKILNSNVSFFSDNYFEQMDLSLREKSSEKKIRSVRRPQPLNTIENLSQIIVDRISISEKQSTEYKSNYSASVTGTSSVKSIENGNIKDFEHQYELEEMIGGIIDKEVVIKSIKRKEDIGLLNKENHDPEQ